jgi:hypothetical protein
MPLDPDIALLITEIDANLSHFDSIAHGLTRDQLLWRPAPGKWSIGECLAHLNKINGPGLPAIRASIAQGRAAGKTGEGPFRYGFVSRKFIATQEPPVKSKFKAPKNMLPPADLDPEATLAEFRRISAELKNLTRDANGLHLVRVKTTLPLLPGLLRKIVRMPLGGRIALITTHDRRHLWQAEQVRNDPAFPS